MSRCESETGYESESESELPPLVFEDKRITALWEMLFSEEERAKITHEASSSCNAFLHPKLPMVHSNVMLEEGQGVPYVETEELNNEEDFEQCALTLQYLHINEINNIWVLKNIIKLSLSNNNIIKVEGLEVLIHLQELDLSCNKLTKLENLKELVHLHELFLTCNMISRLENLDTLKELALFGIGRNLLDNLAECVMYLRPLQNLHTLILEGNPCLKDNTSSRSYVCAYLPQLVFYNYIMITPDEKNQSINEQCEVPEVFWDSASYHMQAKEVKGLRCKKCNLITNDPTEDAIKLSEVLKSTFKKDGIVAKLIKGEDPRQAFESWAREMSKDLFGL